MTSRAFTLVEIVITVLILMIGIITIYETIVQGSQDTRFSRRRTFAAALANNFIEIQKKMHIKNLVDKGGDVPTIYAKAADCQDPLVCPWLDPNVQDLMSKKEDIKKVMEGYQKELKYYAFRPAVIPATDATLTERMCTVQIIVDYEFAEHGDHKYKQVAAAMVLTDPTFPAGKALK